jgi:lipid II:glycine glycyltransferase (peptidoglycan interpeptide bridge formation enzyme)
LGEFADANIYQTYAYGNLKRSERNLSTVVMRGDDQALVAAVVWLFPIPGLGARLAAIKWGPLFRNRNRAASESDVGRFMRFLLDEFVVRRKMTLRIIPSVIDRDGRPFSPHLRAHVSLPHVIRKSVSKTALIDLSQSADDIKAHMTQAWRRNLGKSYKYGVTVVSGSTMELIETFLVLYREMKKRKKFREFADLGLIGKLQQQLEGNSRIRIFLCSLQNRPVSCILVSALGQTGIYLHGATGDAGIECRGSYRLHWEAIQWLKQEGCLFYDLNGIDSHKNPGGYQFKSGLAGKQFTEAEQYEIEIYPNGFQRVLFQCGERMRRCLRGMRE